MRYLDIMKHIVHEATKNSGTTRYQGVEALSLFVAVQRSLFIIRIVDNDNAIYESFSVDLSDPDGLDTAIRKLRFSLNSITRDRDVSCSVIYLYRGNKENAKI